VKIIKNTFLISLLISTIIHAFIFIVPIKEDKSNLNLKRNETKVAKITLSYSNKDYGNIGKNNKPKKLEKINNTKKDRQENTIEYVDLKEGEKNFIPAKPLKEIIIEYPTKARLAGVEGDVIVEIKINEEGKVYEYKILKSLGFGCEEEIIKKIKATEFIPAVLNNKNIKSIQTIKFNFKILK